MKREFLKDLGLEQEIINKILAENGKDIEGLKATNATLTTELNSVKDQLSEANNQIDRFKTLDYDGVKKEASEWKAKAEAAEKDANNKITILKRDYAIDGALAKAKAKNTKAVKALLNLDAVTLSDNGLLGLDEQLSKVKEENAYLFDAEDSKPAGRVVGPTPGAKDMGSEDHAKANNAFREYLKGN